jgi:hypothetical protein
MIELNFVVEAISGGAAVIERASSLAISLRLAVCVVELPSIATMPASLRPAMEFAAAIRRDRPPG